MNTLSRRIFLRIAGAAAGAVGITGCCKVSSNQLGSMRRSKPNIVLIMVDDMGFSDIGCYGGEISTPNIDKLAGNGLCFTQFYNAARCCPTRASILTGLYSHKTGIGFMTAVDHGKPGYRADLNFECVTIAEVLKQNGYNTCMAGKWHVCRDFQEDGPKHNWPLQRGFDRFFGTLIAAGSQWDPLTLVEGNQYIKPEGDFFYTEAITDKAVEYIDSNDPEKPIFLYVAYTAPHWPLHARKEVIEKYRGRFAQGWDILREKRMERLKKRGIIPAETKLSLRDEAVSAWKDVPNKEWQQSRMEAYAAMIDHVDTGIGKILAKLEGKGQLDNSLIFFLSDNGGDSLEHPDGKIGSTGKPWAYMRYVPLRTRDGRPVIAGDIPGVKLGPDDTYGGYGVNWANLSDTPFRKFKKYSHEGGISTPLIVHWPKGIEDKGQIRHQPSHVIDIMATCLAVSGTEYPKAYKGRPIKPLDGKSLTNIFEKDQRVHDVLFWEHHGRRGVRKDKWKLVSVKAGKWELYDMQSDRTETSNLANEHPEIVEQLDALYAQWAANSDVLPPEQLKVKEDPGSGNPLTRSPEEMQEYLTEINVILKQRGLKIFD